MPGGSPETRTAILEAAFDLLTEQDAGTTMAGIAERAGVSRQAVYLHFDSRADLLTALVDWLDTERFDLPGRMAAARDAEDPTARLEAFVDAALAYQPLVAPVAGALMDAADHGDAAAAAVFEDRMEGRLAACRDLAGRLEEAGRLAGHLTAGTAADLLWGLIGYRLWFDLTRGRGWSDDRARRELMALARRALVDGSEG